MYFVFVYVNIYNIVYIIMQGHITLNYLIIFYMGKCLLCSRVTSYNTFDYISIPYGSDSGLLYSCIVFLLLISYDHSLTHVWL